MRRVDVRSGLILGAATLPGAVIGALVSGALSRRLLDLVMGGLLLAVGLFLAVNPRARYALWPDTASIERSLTDSVGTAYRYRFNLLLAAASSLVLGFTASVLGIGGGVIQVPLLTTFFNFPAHIAVATSLFVLLITAGAGTLTHLLRGDYAHFAAITLALAAGAVVGGQFGALLSQRLSGHNLIRLLSVALAVVGLRLLLQP